MTMTALYKLFLNVMIVTPDEGDSDIDAQIASVLGVSSLPYTSNDTNAQTLLPSGWSWSLDAQENIVAVRASDQVTFKYTPVVHGTDDSVTPLSVPDPITHCVVALQARLLATNDIS